MEHKKGYDVILADGHNHDLDAIVAADSKHHLHPWDDLANWQGAERFSITHADGIHIYDANGRKFIDGPAGMWAVQIGYGRREMAEAIAA